MAGNRFIERAVTDEIMYSLMQLGGQQYVDVYAASLKNKDAKKVEPTPAVKPESAA